MDKKVSIKKIIDKLVLITLVIILIFLSITLGQKIYKEATKPIIKTIYVDDTINDISIDKDYKYINIQNNNDTLQLEVTDNTIFNTLYMSKDCKSIEDLKSFLNIYYEISINYDEKTDKVTYVGIYHNDMKTPENI